jgi:hypothetical protein
MSTLQEGVSIVFVYLFTYFGRSYDIVLNLKSIYILIAVHLLDQILHVAEE